MERLPLDTIAVREVPIRYRGRTLGGRAPITEPRNLVHLAKRIVTDDARETSMGRNASSEESVGKETRRSQAEAA